MEDLDSKDQQKPTEQEAYDSGKESSVMREPLVIFNGVCDHNWEYFFTDGDGRKNYRCTKCIMGKVTNE